MREQFVGNAVFDFVWLIDLLHYNPSVSTYYGLAVHSIHVVCGNFNYEWWDLQFKINFER